MTDVPWTPGPWVLDRFGTLIGKDGGGVTFAGFGGGLVSATRNPRAVANTKLAHEAPAMAEALEDAERDMVSALALLTAANEPTARLDHRIVQIRAILRRIKGEA